MDQTWKLIKQALGIQGVTPSEWHTAKELAQIARVHYPDLLEQTLIRSGVYANCINISGKKDYGYGYRIHPVFITDDPSLRGKRFRLLNDEEVAAFRANPRDDLEYTSYSRTAEWLLNPETDLGESFDDADHIEEENYEATSDAIFEAHLQAYIFSNWHQLFSNLSLVDEEYEGHYRTTEPNVGVLDFLARKDNGDYVVIELKKGRPDRCVIGQTLEYMGWVRSRLCAKSEQVEGIVVASELSEGLKLAVKMVPNLALFSYSFSIALTPVSN